MNMEPKHRLSQPGSVLFQKSVEDPDFWIFFGFGSCFRFYFAVSVFMSLLNGMHDASNRYRYSVL